MRLSPKKWSTKAVEEFLRQIENTGKMSRYSPFHNGDTTLRASDLNFTYTEEEEAEIAKISTNIFYFAITYAYVTTDDGIMQVKHLRQYQKRALASFIKHLKIVWLASRKIGKSITVGIFIVHYILTHTDRNIVLLSQNQDKVVDLMEKIRTIIKNLPFYMKPGIKTDNVMTMKFENGCDCSYTEHTQYHPELSREFLQGWMNEPGRLQPEVLNKIGRASCRERVSSPV